MERACRQCRIVTDEKQCPVCKSDDLSNSWKGLMIITKPDQSEIAETADITTPGTYAVKVL